jgi:hypothetical protein
VFVQLLCDTPKGLPVETESFSKLHGATWAIQVENGFTVSTDHVNVRRTVIVRIDDDTQVIEA